jgi:hypothetical protein
MYVIKKISRNHIPAQIEVKNVAICTTLKEAQETIYHIKEHFKYRREKYIIDVM